MPRRTTKPKRPIPPPPPSINPHRQRRTNPEREEALLRSSGIDPYSPSSEELLAISDLLNGKGTPSPAIQQAAERETTFAPAQEQLQVLRPQQETITSGKPLNTKERRVVARYLLQLRKAEESFPDFCDLLRPLYTPKEFVDSAVPDFLRTLQKELDHLAKTPGANLLITMPPRHLKSTHASQLLPAYFMGKFPTAEIIQVTYNADLASDFGRKVRDFISNPLYQQVFPNTQLSPSTRAQEKWATVAGGLYVAVGVGGTATGRGANLLIIDDPIKNREEAESATYRNKVWQEYVATFSTRGLHDVRKLVILTRWHPDDLAGRLMASDIWKTEGWRHVNFPAIIEEPTQIRMRRSQLPQDHPMYLPEARVDVLSNAKRDILLTRERALWPEIFPLDRLKRQRSLDEREFASLYMQSPYLKGGNLIKHSWWRLYEPDPSNPPFFLPQGTDVAALVIGADTGFKDKEDNDPSVFEAWALSTAGDIYLLETVRKRLTFPDLKREAILLNNKYRGRGLRGLYIEDKASGQSLIQELKNQSGVSVIAHKMAGDKVTKAKSISPLIEGGRVYVPSVDPPGQDPWLDAFMQEIIEFPGSAHDDQVDAMVVALDALSKLNLASSDAFNVDLTASLRSQFTSNYPALTRQASPNQPFGSLPGMKSWKGWGM